MELDAHYASQVRQHLGFFPTWPPGDAIALGDIGTLKKGLFRREGKLANIVSGLDIERNERPVKGLTTFRSSDCSSSGLHAEGTAPAATGVTANAKMTLTFGNAGGIAFDAANCTEQTIANLLAVREGIQAQRDNWRAGFVLVTRVTVAASFLVVVAGQAGASVEVAGSADALGQWNLGKATISSAAGNQAGFQRTGDGPIMMGLYGFDWWNDLMGGQMKPLSLTEPPHSTLALKELPARSKVFD